MKILVYIWRNIRRNKVRSMLTILSVGFSLALMTVLYGFMASQETWRNDAEQTNRIVVMNIQGFTGQVPISAHLRGPNLGACRHSAQALAHAFRSCPSAASRAAQYAAWA